MTAKPDALTRAIEILGAAEVAPGKYAYWDDATRRYYISSEADLCRLSGYSEAVIEDGASTGEAYSRWCSDTQATEMPSWWTPDARIMLRCRSCSAAISRWPKEDAWKVDRCKQCDTSGSMRIKTPGMRVITADLETGKEILA